MKKDYAIIVAGGKGLRMGGDIPKQFLPIGGMPILMRTLLQFKAYDPDLQLIMVLPTEQHDYWHSLCYEYNFPLPSSGETGRGYHLADGGATRFHSVLNGLSLIPDDAEGLVSVHDGVRPFATVEVIRRCYEAARIHQAVIPVMPVVESLRHIDKNFKPQTSNFKLQTSHAVPRDEYRLVQTPQVFDIQLLKRAYRQPYTETFTDDASVVEALGQEVTLVEGCRENIKITTPFDLTVAQCLIEAHEAYKSHEPYKPYESYKSYKSH